MDILTSNDERFFNIVVNLFRKSRGSWAADTLAFLTKQLPLLQRKAKRKRAAPIDDSEDDDDNDDPTGILALQAARSEVSKDKGLDEMQDTTGERNEPITPPRSSPGPAENHVTEEPASPPVNRSRLFRREKRASLDEDGDGSLAKHEHIQVPAREVTPPVKPKSSRAAPRERVLRRRRNEHAR